MARIGIFDSGVGGVTVLRALRAVAPAHTLDYVADELHLPYGPRPQDEVRAFSVGITRFLRARGADVVVVACNTASAAALDHLRGVFPGFPIVGMEPAVKPAALGSRRRVIGVIATPGTFTGSRFPSLKTRFAEGVTVLEEPCPGLVQRIESGDVESASTEEMLRGFVEPLLAQGMDMLVLGCTHYPFVLPLLERICGPDVRVIDPAPAVARQVERVLASRAGGAGETKAASAEPASLLYFTSGMPAHFESLLARLHAPAAPVRGAQWRNGELAAIYE